MAVNRQYKMYRKDSQGSIEVDLDDPVTSLANLLDKAAFDESEQLQKVKDLTSRLEMAKEYLKQLTESRVKFEDAYRKVSDGL